MEQDKMKVKQHDFDDFCHIHVYNPFYLAKDIYLSHGAPQISQLNYHFIINIFEELPPLQESRKTDMLDFESLSLECRSLIFKIF